MFWTEDRLLWLARMIGIVGFGALVWSGIGVTIMASKSAGWLARRLPRASAFLKGSRLFTNHRRFSLIGAALFLAHPIPMLFAPKTTGQERNAGALDFAAPFLFSQSYMTTPSCGSHPHVQESPRALGA